MKLNWFSPLPPARTEIANNVMHNLPTLSRQAELTIWTDQDEVDANVAAFGDVRRYTPHSIDFLALNNADATIYHLGNNAAFHANILQVSKRFPGIVILHDLVLHGLFLPQVQIDDTIVTNYRQLIAGHYGEDGGSAYDNLLAGKVDLESYLANYPLYQPAIDNALAAVVHNKYAFESLSREELCPVARIPLPYKPSSVISRDRTLPPPPCKLIIFGHIGASRRLTSVFDALAGMCAPERFRLDIIGSLWNEPLIRQQLTERGLSEIVTVHGFVAEKDLASLLNSAHLAINLRSPTMGETSASQLRIWENKLPSLVTRVGWYAELPEDVVAFVRPEHEIEDIRTHLSAFLEDPQQFIAMGENGYRYLLEHHSPEIYVRNLLEFVANISEFRLRYMAVRLSEHVGNLLSPWLTPENGSYCIKRVSERICEFGLG